MVATDDLEGRAVAERPSPGSAAAKSLVVTWQLKRPQFAALPLAAIRILHSRIAPRWRRR
jgi:hypothetical protein